MKTKYKILLSVSTLTILATTLFAHPSLEQVNIQKSTKQMTHHKRKGNPIIDMVMQLDLTKEQKENIAVVVKESRILIKHPTDAFTKSTFDKNSFIQIIKEKDVNRIQREAELVEKIYNLLNKTQKKHLKTMLDMDEIKHTSLKNHSHIKCEERK